MTALSRPARPWYRHPWPWLLMIPPAATVIFWAVILTTLVEAPSMVVDDYAKIGRAFQQSTEREDRAAALGVRADVTVADGAVSVTLAGSDPDALVLTLAHPTDDDRDQRILLSRTAGGEWHGPASTPLGRRHVQIEPSGGEWRLTATLQAGASGLQLMPRGAAAP